MSVAAAMKLLIVEGTTTVVVKVCEGKHWEVWLWGRNLLKRGELLSLVSHHHMSTQRHSELRHPLYKEPWHSPGLRSQ